MALAALVAVGVSAFDAHALGLGRVTVQSALGEPFRADIDLTEITPEEVASLRARVAAPDAFRAAGLEYSPALQNVTITLQRRPDGRYFLRLASDRPVNDPFVDLILEANWSSGRIVRDYTMLFDPPNLRDPSPLTAQTSPVPAPAPMQAAPAARPPAAVAPAARPPAVASRPATTPSTPAARAPAARPAAPAARPPVAAAAPTPSGDGKRYTVKEGDNATRIASANKPASISLDQMLLALLRNNPGAFEGNNVNRLKAGAVLELPSAAQAGQVEKAEAEQVLVAQSRDFDEFRRRLAEGLPVRDMRSGDRVVSGRVTASVEDKRPAAASPDKLTLSKGAAASAGQIAQQRAAQDAATRVAELNKNIADLGKVGTAAGTPGGTASAPRPGIAVPGAPAASGPARAASMAAPAPVAAAATTPARTTATAAAPTPMAAATPAPAPAAPAPAPATTAATTPGTATPTVTTPAGTTPASATATAAMPASAPAAAVAAAPTPAPAPKPAAKAPPPPPPPPPSFMDELMENPLVPAAVVGLLAILAGLGFYKVRQRRKATQVDSSFLESRLQPDSFFGASGGQRIDTAEGSSSATGSSMVYSPSQLDAAGDVDPVAEADVYLAYGRDLQAEEILKEALRTNPSRVAIHSKLLEIYAKRRDAKAFELVATEAYNLTHGEGPEWEHICELGRELDASNPMYSPGGKPEAGAVAAAAAAMATPNSFGATVAQPAVAQQSSAPAVDFDLDLDFSLGDEPPAPAPAASAAAPAVGDNEKTQAIKVDVGSSVAPGLDVDFGDTPPASMMDDGPTRLPTSSPLPPPPAPSAALETVKLEAPDLTLNENAISFDLDTPPPAAQPAPAAPAPAPAKEGMIEFDLGSLSLDLPGSEKAAAAPPDAGDSTAGAPLSTAGLEHDESGDPLATKLALAEEFNAIGDPDGARSLAEEVLAEASGELKNRAQKLLAEIG